MIRTAILKPPAARTPFEAQMARKAKPYLENGGESFNPPFKGEAKARYDALRKELAQFDDLPPEDPPEGIGLRDLSAVAPATHILRTGNWNAPQQEVQPGFLTLLDPTDAKIVPPNAASAGRRAALAR